MLRNDGDCWSIKTGGEGVGKSNEGIWFGHLISPETFRIQEHIVYEPDDFLQAVLDAKKYTSIVLDEGGEAWYNRDFATRINKAMAKAAMQIRERNLNIIICVPRWHYLDNVVLYRHKFRTHCHEIRDTRGFAEYYEAKWDPFTRSEIPFWDELFRYRFQQLPPKISAIYKEIKRTKGEERLIQYIEIVRKERDKVNGNAEDHNDPNIIVEEIERTGRDKYLNSRGNVDSDLIRYYYKCTNSVARQASIHLNST